MVFMVCSYGGQINYGMNNMPMYVGGVTAPLMISESCSYNDLITELHRITEIDPREYRLKVICNWPITFDRTTAVEISNNHHMSIMFSLSNTQPTVELFIEKIPVSSGQICKPPGEFSRMLLDLGVLSDGFQYRASTSQNNVEMAQNMRVLRETTVEEDERSDDSEGEDDSAPLDSMEFVTEDVEENPRWPEEAYVNNEYVEFEEPPPDEFEDNEWIRSSTVEDVGIGKCLNGAKDDEDFIFKVGDLFETKDQLVDAIRNYSINKIVKFKQVKSNRTSFDAICFMNTERKGQAEGNEADYTCPWKLYAFAGKKHNGWFKITKYCGLHTCSNPIAEQDHSGASASYIARLIMPKLKKRLDLKPDDIIERVNASKFIEISYSKAWNARRIAMTKIFGDWEKSYATLPQYLDAIKRSNPGTEYKLNTKAIKAGVEQFTSVFWAFGPSIEGFKFCRPVLSIDGTHLYSKYKGVLLVSTGVYADGVLFPLAFAVVEVENCENWE